MKSRGKITLTSSLRIMLCACIALVGCKELESEEGSTPTRAVAANKSSATGTVGETGLSVPVQVFLADKRGRGVGRITPTIAVVDGSGNAVAGISSEGCGATNAAGYASCFVVSEVLGTYRLKVTSPVTFISGAVAFQQVTRSLEFSTQPSSFTTSGVPINTQPVVRLLDRLGNLNTSGTDTVTLSLTTPNGAVLSGTTTEAAVGGVANFAGNGLSVDLKGTYTFTARAASASAAVSSTFTINAGAATHIAFVTQPSAQTPAGNAFAQAPVVAVQDAAGNTTTSTCVIDLSLSASPAGTHTLLGSALSKAATGGIVDYSGTNLRIATSDGGTGYEITATPNVLSTCNGMTAITTDPFEITRLGVPSQLSLTQDPSTSALNQVWSVQPVVRILDDNGNLVSTDNSTVVTVSKTAGPAGPLSGTTSVTAVNGVASFTNLRIGSTNPAHAGTYTLSFDASNPNLPGYDFGAVTHPLEITDYGLVGAHLLFETQPGSSSTSTVAGQNLPPFKVKVVDANGVTCTVCTDQITIGFHYGSGSIAGTDQVNATAGVATFSNLRFSEVGLKQVSATAAGLTTAYSNTFMIYQYGTASKLAVTQTPDSGTSNGQTPWQFQPEIAIQDTFGNTVLNDSTTQVTLTCVQPSAGCTLLGTQTVQATNGVAIFTDLRTLETGITNMVLEATATGLVGTQTNGFDGN